MRFRCIRCGYEATTFGDKKLKFRVNEALFEDLHCPRCYSAMELCDVCKARITREGNRWIAVCNGCPEYFNCLTGNVDDGVAPKAKQIVQTKEDMIEQYKRKKHGDMLKYYTDKLHGKFSIHKAFEKNGEVVLSVTINKCTKLNISEKDIDAIIKGTWDTEKTKLIYHTMTKYGCDVKDISSFVMELLARTE